MVLSSKRPVLVKCGMYLQVVEKQRATLELEVNEDDVEGRWLRSGVEIQFLKEKRFLYTTLRRIHRLNISETYRSDAGEYTFLAGRNSSTLELQIRRKSTVNSSCLRSSSNPVINKRCNFTF